MGYYLLVATKKRWIPEWLWWLFARVQLPSYQPFRRWLTDDVQPTLNPDEDYRVFLERQR